MFNQSAGQQQTNRVTNSIQGHDIFNAGVSSKVTHNDHRDKAVSTRYNQNHGGKTIFQDGSATPTPKTREVKTLQDSNIFGNERREGTVQQMEAKKTGNVRVNDNHVNQVISTKPDTSAVSSNRSGAVDVSAIVGRT